MPTSIAAPTNNVSNVLGTPAASGADAHTFFSRKLGFETDPADVYADMSNGVDGFIVIDVRSAEAYARSHVPGARNIPQSTINQSTAAELDASKLLVLYCWGPGCNGATKAAIKFSALGFQVKEMIGGIEYWEEKEQYPVERGERREEED